MALAHSSGVAIDNHFDPLYINTVNDALCKRSSFRRNKRVSMTYARVIPSMVRLTRCVRVNKKKIRVTETTFHVQDRVRPDETYSPIFSSV